MKMKIFQVMTAITVTHTVLSNLLTVEQRQLVSCGLTILRHHFKTGRNLLVSFSHTSYNNTTQLRTFKQASSQRDDIHFMNSILQNIHDTTGLILHVSNPNQPSLETTHESEGKIDYCLVIVRPECTDEEIFDEVLDHFHNFLERKSGNQRALFLVMLTGTSKEPKLLSRKIFDAAWKSENILNIVLLAPKNELLLRNKLSDTGITVAFDLYTWFPYRSGHCASVEEITLIDQWIVTNKGDFLNKVPLFPNKIPTNLQSCPLRVHTTVDEPFVFLDNDTQYSNNFKHSGLEIQFLLITIQAMNASLVYLPPPTGSEIIRRMSMVMGLSFGSCDLIVGTVPLNLNIMEYADATIPHLQTSFRWYIPCPTPIPRVERILGIFTLPVWLTLILVFILTAATLWCYSNFQISFEEKEHPMCKTVAGSLCNTLAVYVAVPVPKLPCTPKIRAFFCLFVWYCFAINIVFQAFFITFMVEPGYSKKIETFDDIVKSGLIYGYQEEIEIALNNTFYHEQTKIKSPRFRCSHYTKCLERLISQGDIAMVSPAFNTDYNAFKLNPNTKKWKQVCFLDDDIHKILLVMYLQLGSPLLHRFNTIIRRIIESGLIENYWSLIEWGIRVKHMANSTQDGSFTDDKQYFALTLSHLKIAFILLTLGLILSSIVFTGELLCTLISTRGKCNKK